MTSLDQSRHDAKATEENEPRPDVGTVRIARHYPQLPQWLATRRAWLSCPTRVGPHVGTPDTASEKRPSSRRGSSAASWICCSVSICDRGGGQSQRHVRQIGKLRTAAVQVGRAAAYSKGTHPSSHDN
eukprot:gene260-biopygen3865